MQTIGERLEEARKKKGISIREAAEATKIRGDYLSKFENNQFDINLTELYVRGFLRTYAQFLRLPADRILNDYAALGRGETRPRQPSREIYGRMDVSVASADDAGHAEPAPAEEPAPVPVAARRTSHANRRPSAGGSQATNIDPALVFKTLKWVGIGVAVLLVLWGVKSLFSGSKPSAARPSAQPAATAPVSAAGPQVTGPTVTIIALDVVRVKVAVKNPDGSTGEVLLPDTTMSAGEQRVLPKKGPLYLTATALQNVAIEENGRRTNIRDQGISGYDRVQIGR